MNKTRLKNNASYPQHPDNVILQYLSCKLVRLCVSVCCIGVNNSTQHSPETPVLALLILLLLFVALHS